MIVISAIAKGGKEQMQARHDAIMLNALKRIVPGDVILELHVIRASGNYLKWPSHAKKMLTQVIQFLEGGSIKEAIDKLEAIDIDMKPRSRSAVELSIERLKEIV